MDLLTLIQFLWKLRDLFRSDVLTADRKSPQRAEAFLW